MRLKHFTCIFFVLILCCILFSCEFYTEKEPSLVRENWQPFGAVWKGVIQNVKTTKIENYDLELLVSEDKSITLKVHNKEKEEDVYDVYKGEWSVKTTMYQRYHDPDMYYIIPIYDWHFTTKIGDSCPWKPEYFDGYYSFMYWGNCELVKENKNKEVYYPTSEATMQLYCSQISEFYELSLIEFKTHSASIGDSISKGVNY